MQTLDDLHAQRFEFCVGLGGGDVEVGERAAVVPALSGAPTVVLTMPVGVMTRRCAGRVGPDDLLDQVVIDGDLELASKILANQSYTI